MFAQQNPTEFAFNCYLNSNRDSLQDTPTMDNVMKRRYEEIIDGQRFGRQKISIARLNQLLDPQVYDDNRPSTQSKYRDGKFSLTPKQSLNSRQSTRCKSKVTTSLDNRKSIIINQQTIQSIRDDSLIDQSERKHVVYKSYDILSKQEVTAPRNVTLLAQSLPPEVTPSLPNFEVYRVSRITKSKEQAAKDIYKMFKNVKDIPILEQQDLEEKENKGLKHVKKFQHFYKCKREVKELPSQIFLSYQQSGRPNEIQNSWVKHSKTKGAKKEFLKQEPYVDPLDHQCNVFRGPSYIFKRRPWLYFRPSKPHDWNKEIGDQLSYADQKNFY